MDIIRNELPGNMLFSQVFLMKGTLRYTKSAVEKSRIRHEVFGVQKTMETTVRFIVNCEHASPASGFHIVMSP